MAKSFGLMQPPFDSTRLVICALSSRRNKARCDPSGSPHNEGTAQTITSCGSHHFEPRGGMIAASIADDQRQKSLNRCGDSSV